VTAKRTGAAAVERRALLREIAALVVVAVSFAAFAIRLDFFEAFDAFLRRHELHHLDELVLTVAVVLALFAGFSARRWFGLARRIEERDLAEAALEKERDFTTTVLDTVSSLVLVLDRDGRIVRFNRACERATGWTADEVSGRPYWELLPPAADVARQRAAFVRLFNDPGTSSDETTWLARDGSERRVQWTHTVVQDDRGEPAYVVSTGHDVTAERRSAAQLRASEQKLEAILDSIDDFVWSQRADDRAMIFMSSSFERIYGVPSEALRDDPRAWERVVHPADRERVREFVPLLTRTGRASMEYRIVHRDGSVRWVLDRAWGVKDEAGRWTRFDGIARDVTDQKQLEEQFRQSQKMEAVGLLAGGIAHDFNNLLTAIGGYAGLLVERLVSDPDSLKHARAVQRAADRAAALTRQLLAFSRKQVLQPKVFSPNTLLVDLEPLVRRLIGEDVELAVETSPALGDVRADVGQIEQVVMNLVVNARDAMPRGGRLLLRTENVMLDAPSGTGESAVPAGRYVALVVTDSGQGMSEAVRARIFEPFFTTKPTGKGTGLGLSTAYGIVRQSGGQIRVESVLGRGTEFRVLLPRHDGGKDPDAPAPGTRAIEAPRGETILVVEDEPSVLDLAREVLESQGHRVLTSVNGREALDAARRHAREIRLVLTDVVMPQMGGIELVEALGPILPAIPVVFMSGYSEAVVRREGMVTPGAGFVQKPFRSDDLARAVRFALDRALST
jgi:two-component system cell cycle sensor histidine kinase/response regulator CckA